MNLLLLLPFHRLIPIKKAIPWKWDGIEEGSGFAKYLYYYRSTVTLLTATCLFKAFLISTR